MKKRVLSLFLVLIMLIPASPVLANDTCTHDWSYWYEEISPDCSNPGKETRFCYICDEEQSRSLPATGDHEWDDWEVTKNATIFRTGIKSRECWLCDKVQTAVIPKLKPFVKLNKKKLSLTVGNSYRLKASYARGDSAKKWKSSKKKIATVSKKGVIKALRTGTTRITIYTKSGKKATCKVTVTARKKVTTKRNSSSKSSKKSSSGSGGSSSKTNVSTVYWTPGGSVYHRTPNCPTLKRSRIIRHGSISSCPKSRGCKVCF